MNSPRRLTVDEYFDDPETLRPMELVHGIVREPPAPLYGHQVVVMRAIILLERHVRANGLGTVCVSPIDVVLDRDAALVVQPDLIFVSTARTSIIRDRIWGAPDLVVEVLSPEGKWLRAIPSGNITTSNVAFGGPNHDQLFVTGGLGKIGEAPGAVWRVDLGVKGLKILP